MKIQTIYSVLVVIFCTMMFACTEADEMISGNDTPPSGALPSTEFVLNDLSDEAYIEDAIHIVAMDESAPFYTLELMSDGNYLLTFDRSYNTYKNSVLVKKKGNGLSSVSKNRKLDVSCSRSTTDENGTMMLYDGSEYGKFTKLGDKRYRLSNGVEVDLQNVTESNKTISYKNLNGRISHVYVSVSEPIVKNGTKSLCRTWNYNSFEMWAYWNGKYIIHAKQTVNDGKVNTYFKTIGGDMFESEDYLGAVPYKVVFTSVGTYLCFYLNDEVDVSQWSWENETQGILYYHRMNEGYEWNGDVTIRFAGNQMRMYEDYTESEEDMDVRIVAVNTLTVAN